MTGVYLEKRFKLSLLIFTALLICTENTFWVIRTPYGRDYSFVELFKQSFTLYVESGMGEMMEADIDILRNERGEFLVTTPDFNAKFYQFIIEHFLSHSESGKSGASGELRSNTRDQTSASASGEPWVSEDQVF